MAKSYLKKMGSEYRWEASGSHANLARRALIHIFERAKTSDLAELYFGENREFVEQLLEKLMSWSRESPIDLTVRELHVIYSAINSTLVKFASEEDYWHKIGFFKENSVAVSNKILLSVVEQQESPL